MALRILLQNQPTRSINIVSESHALLIRASSEAWTPATSDRYATSKITASFVVLDDVDLVHSQVLCPKGFGTLGVVSFDKDLFLCVITAASPVASVRPGELVQRILAVEFCNLIWPFPSSADAQR